MSDTIRHNLISLFTLKPACLRAAFTASAPMPARPDTAQTTALAIEILRLIPRHTKVTASQLHQQLLDKGFNRDLRTIQRQLDMLSQHFDIERDDTNRPYGWRWKPHSSGLNLSYLTPQESLLLHLAEAHLRNLLPAPLMRSMDSFFVQAQRTLSPQRAARARMAAQNPRGPHQPAPAAASH